MRQYRVHLRAVRRLTTLPSLSSTSPSSCATHCSMSMLAAIQYRPLLLEIWRTEFSIPVQRRCSSELRPVTLRCKPIGFRVYQYASNSIEERPKGNLEARWKCIYSYCRLYCDYSTYVTVSIAQGRVARVLVAPPRSHLHEIHDRFQ